MAEQEPTAEQLAQIAAENEEDEHSVNYKPPAQKSIQEIQELDKDDESLRKYKEALLGAVTVTAGELHFWLPGLSSAPVWELFSPQLFVTWCEYSQEHKGQCLPLFSGPWNKAVGLRGCFLTSEGDVLGESVGWV